MREKNRNFARYNISLMKPSFLFLAAILAAACSSNGAKTGEPAIPTVEAVTVSSGKVSDVHKDIGTVRESRSLSLSFLSAGHLVSVCASEGDYVPEGFVLAEIDKISLQNSYDAALATRNQAEDAYRRMEKLHGSGSITEMQWVEVQSKVQTARSMEQISAQALKNAELKAPVSGLISKRNIEPGENVVPGMSVFTLVDIDKVNIVFPVSDKDISKINLGESVAVTSDAGEYVGKVTGKGIRDDAVAHTYEVKVSVANPGHRLLPGMICRASIVKDVEEGLFVIPRGAVLLNFDNTRFVWCIENGIARMRPVRIGKATSEGVAIAEGLNEGDRVIVKGVQKVSDGMKVNEK